MGKHEKKVMRRRPVWLLAVAILVLAGVSVSQLASATTTGGTTTTSGATTTTAEGTTTTVKPTTTTGATTTSGGHVDLWGDFHVGRDLHLRCDHNDVGGDDQQPGGHHELGCGHGLVGSKHLDWRGLLDSGWRRAALHRRAHHALAVRGPCPARTWGGEPGRRGASTPGVAGHGSRRAASEHGRRGWCPFGTALADPVSR